MKNFTSGLATNIVQKHYSGDRAHQSYPFKIIQMKQFLLIILLGLGISTYSQKRQQDPYLSNLKATKDSPIYTTYAAALERSEFVLDEGYEFRFFNPEEGIGFNTDNSGDIQLGFIIDGKWIFREKDMFRAPVISASYPDMVKYSYYPVDGLRVDAQFLVQSSRMAIWDINLLNETGNELEVQVVPFMKNDYRAYEEIDSKKAQNAFIFTHQVYPDSWTISHELPYEDTIKNVFLVSENGLEKKVFNSYGGESPKIPFQVALDKESVFQVTGRALKNEKERILSTAPRARIQVFRNGNSAELITENSPLFGLAQPSIDAQGYMRIELGNFSNLNIGDTYSVSYFNEDENLGAGYTDTLQELKGGKRNDLKVSSYDLPEIPQNVGIIKNRDSIQLNWETSGNDLVYHVYKRTYPQGIYHRIAKSLKNTVFHDKDVTEGVTYGYVVLSEDTKTGKLGMHSREANTLETSSFNSFLEGGNTSEIISHARGMAFKKSISLAAGEKKNVRMVRLISESSSDDSELITMASSYLDENLEKYLRDNEQLFSKVPHLNFEDEDKEMLYWSAFNMMRQVFYPPEGKSSYNYYVFSREPTWGWGHGGQVFHESITMLAYAFMDPQSAMDSQRVYSERQYDNGYINYRTGSYLDEIIEYNDQLTSSAPWYAWQNWELYKITKDKEFLREMYDSSKKFYNFYTSNRDADNDGLSEWGGHAVLESVRDALVAVWDEVAWPANFEGVDVNSMLVKEAKALEAMALELGHKKEARAWRADYKKRSKLIKKVFWDDEKDFFFNADLKDNDFTYEKPDDLKREEIIGFLPLWAGVSNKKQAQKLVDKLTDPDKFWRKYGIPSLAADDPYYNDKGYWNGPVWVEWNFLITQGLLEYGYKDVARELVDRVAEGMTAQLKQNHNLWEFYSPDEKWGGYHKTYIWAGIINRMMMDTAK